MLKRRDSPYVAGRARGLWYKWKRDPLRADCVLMYAQRGNGKRSSYYSDYTFGCWTDGSTAGCCRSARPISASPTRSCLARPLRAPPYVQRFGPVREVVHEADQGLVLEVAFDGLQRSKRHKSGLAMRFPRISRMRWDKPPRRPTGSRQLERMLEQIEGARAAAAGKPPV